MTTFSLQQPKPVIAVEYLRCGKRVRKEFLCAYEARSFYVQKDKRLRDPKVVKVA